MQQIFICSKCGTQNGLGQRFCVGCGTTLSTFCPYCSADLPPTSRFCTNCGTYLGWDKQQAVIERKPTSGWAKFGTAMFILGVLCIIIVPVVILIMPSSENSLSLMIRWIIAGLLGIAVGLPLMFRR